MPFVTTTIEDGVPKPGTPVQGPTATLLYDDWYPALRTETLRPNKLATATLLDIPLVLGRAPMAASSPCATAARTAAFPSATDGSTATMSPAAITAGSSSLAAANAR